MTSGKLVFIESSAIQLFHCMILYGVACRGCLNKAMGQSIRTNDHHLRVFLPRAGFQSKAGP